MKNKILGEKKRTSFDENLADKVNKIFDSMPETPEVKPVIGNVCLYKFSDGFVFHNLANIGSVKLLNAHLDGKSEKTHDGWRTHCAERSDGIVVPNSVVLYQMARALYELRNDSSYQEIVKECIDLFHKDWGWYGNACSHTGTEVRYGPGLDAVVESLQLDGSIKKINLEILEFTKSSDARSYLVLAPEQDETNLGKVNLIPDKAKPVLQKLLGEGYEHAGEVFQYLSPRRNGNLREIKLWTPTLTERNSERAVVFGVGDGYFGIYADGSINYNRPSRGVVAVRERSVNKMKKVWGL
ncbi:hypothetical protein HZA97_01145 [Candidatus Woesearchaeota archaeon]|nr:hypothetical protein [Candidatus Woesearchaeota archaeon]